MSHRGKEKNEENFWIMVRTWTNWNLLRELLGAGGLKEGAVGVVGEKSQQKRPSGFQEGETSQAETSERKERQRNDRLLGMSSLKEGAMLRIVRQQLGKHVPTNT
jgi:hypothetical protein